jgi:hypothetical protein
MLGMASEWREEGVEGSVRREGVRPNSVHITLWLQEPQGASNSVHNTHPRCCAGALGSVGWGSHSEGRPMGGP